MMSSNDKKQSNGNAANKSKTLIKPESIRKIKSIASHVGLLVTLMIYTAIGGVVFRELELPSELQRLSELKDTLLVRRQELIDSVNRTNVTELADWIESKLHNYEDAVQNAARSGLSLNFKANVTATEKDIISADRWSILQAVFFASTILTTIGYGNVYPSTFFGRMFCIFFALIGIPLTLTVIADYGKLFAEGVSSLAKKIRTKLPKSLSACVPTNQAGKKSLGAFAAVLLLFIYLACGAGLFTLWEANWSFFEGFYFCFVTMTTIGFGDLVPTNPKYMLFCTLYILVGLALTSTIIELVRMQYADSWKRLQALSGPFADTLRKLGEHAGGDMSAFQTDLRRVMKVISMPRRRKSGVENRDMKDSEWEEAVQAILRDISAKHDKKDAEHDPEMDQTPIVQIIVYESSV